ncbi:hypothetical protein SL053_002076 [Flavobacterium psychrophilum]|jgi:hypothetical protein|uniref:hypothetical protein n=1 Tax=Flavobacterium psychrophilum TaxID=96345 RepID=UPI000A3D11A2|nr:hypothetical protein [Flavobacterium psychrophilum]EKT3956623.1 hypothetical protein [Flavobacterium psychrophilum]EKT4498771.1 hypothetical protein [Flavobacterium psychrophilum]EKT4501182.1 hypothetical protein [Flavobacterium psychrophilum]EKT4509351.1 hypothetical protein [Flavobacterium psychrophilum]EKT4549755.1 hypothetical protein [Flavobacterium psychrophilum]
MIDINKFEELANEIIANSTKSEMENWFENYRIKEVSFVSFKPIEAKFKMDFSKLDFHTKETETPSNRYSLAA